MPDTNPNRLTNGEYTFKTNTDSTAAPLQPEKTHTPGGWARFAGEARLYQHDALPAWPADLAKPTSYIEFNNGAHTWFQFGDGLDVEFWSGSDDEVYNSVDDGGRFETSWPEDWTDEQQEEAIQWMTEVQRHVDADVYGITISAVSGDVATAILANATGELYRQASSDNAIDNAVERANRVLPAWVDNIDSEPQTALEDALNDLRHWARSRGIDFDEAISESVAIFEDELRHPGI